MTQTYDAIVVGAGFAGAAAAREFGAAGLRTVVLEARDRVGGRTHTVDFSGQRVEMGGTWVHWNQPHIWSELTRYGIDIIEDSWDFESIILGNPPRRYEPEEGFAELRRVFTKLCGEGISALPMPHDPARAGEAALRLDELSVQDRLDELGLTPDDQAIAESLLYEIAGGPFKNVAFLNVLRWLALCGWDVARWYNDSNRYRPVGGTRAVIEAMLEDSRADVVLGAVVKSIDATNDQVIVTTVDGQEFRAANVVVAAPVNVWNDISFHPALPAPHQRLAVEGVGKPTQDKLWIWARGEKLRPVFGQLPAPAPVNFYWTAHIDGDRHLLIGINANGDLDVDDHEAVAEVFRQNIPEIDEVLEVRTHSWGRDPFSRGGNSCPRPGQLELMGQIRNPVGRVAFAGADLARGWYGYIDGAVESGIHASHSLLRASKNVRQTTGVEV